MDSLLSGISAISIKDIIMIVIGCILIYLAIYKKFEPTLLLPMGFGVIMANLPLSGAITQLFGDSKVVGILDLLFSQGIATELFPLLIFIGIGSMIDFEPLLQKPFTIFLGSSSSTWNIFNYNSSFNIWIWLKRSCIYRNNRGCWWTDFYICSISTCQEFTWTNICSSIFLYGTSAYHSAICYKTCYNKGRKNDKNELYSRQSI